MTERRRRFRQKLFDDARTQAADVVLGSSIDFLLRNGISKKRIRQYVGDRLQGKNNGTRKSEFRIVTEAYEEMGTVLSTWFDCPHFLTPQGSPESISVGTGALSLRRLLKTAKVRLSSTEAIDLFRQSPSVRFNLDGSISALRRVFVLSSFDLCRAGLVLPRYIDTLSSNSSAYKTGTVKLLERQCSVSRIDLRAISPILRSIKEQGGSFVDSVDNQIERRKIKPRGRRDDSELGLLVFAWTKTRVRKAAKTRVR
jgi:hypothetical protein